MRTDRDLKIRVGHDEMVIRRRYESLSIANDVLIALWFVAGSVLFFWDSTARVATWMFLLGSIEFLARPLIPPRATSAPAPAPTRSGRHRVVLRLLTPAQGAGTRDPISRR